MATYYLDYEGGNDANNGTTFALRWKTLTLGATAARIAPGDTVRIMASPAPTSLGINGTWTSNPLQQTQVITSSTNATPIVITRASHGLVTGDTVVVVGHTTNTNANGTWTVTQISSSTFSLDGSVGNGVGGASGTLRKITGRVVTLASALTQNLASIDNVRTAWTTSANVTAGLSPADFKVGSQSDSIAIGTGFTTGLAAYKATGSALDLSGYQQVSLWIKQASGTVVTAGQITLCLCSDTAGVTTVNTISIPALVANGAWNCITVDNGSALGASIQSVALYVATDLAAQSFLLSNIIACKAPSSADSLTLRSLIGKNDGQWFPIMGIDGTRVTLGGTNALISTTQTVGSYYGTSETVTTYKREAINQGAIAASTTVVNSITEGGASVGNQITFSGGWNRTDMTTQTDETWLRGQNGLGYALTAYFAWITLEKLCFAAYNVGVIQNGSSLDSTFTNLKFAGCTTGLNVPSTSLRNTYSDFIMIGCDTGFDCQMRHCTMNNLTMIAGTIGLAGAPANSVFDTLTFGHNGGNAINLGVSTLPAINCRFNDTAIYASGGGGLNMACAVGLKIDTLTCTGGTNAASFAIQNGLTFSTVISNLTSSGNVTGIIVSGNYVDLSLINCSIAEATDIGAFTGGSGSIVSSQNHNGSGNTIIESDNLAMGTTTAERHTASGVAWFISPLSANRHIAYPGVLTLGKILCAASALVTVKAWLRRTNTGLTLGLVCKGGQIAGVASDVRTDMTAAANTWEEVTITFTPSEAGFVEITAEAYGGTTYTGYVDDMTITQA